MTHSLPSRRYRKGFTLIEIMVVIAIVAIILAIALPNLSNRGNVNVQGYADQIAAYIVRVSNEASETGADFPGTGAASLGNITGGFSFAASNNPSMRVQCTGADIKLGPSIGGNTGTPGTTGRAIVFYNPANQVRGILAFRANGQALLAAGMNRTEIIVKNTKIAYRIKIPALGKPTVVRQPDSAINTDPVDDNRPES